MINGPLVKLAVVFGAILIALSFMLVIFPDMIEMLGALAGIVALAAVIVLIVMFIRFRKV